MTAGRANLPKLGELRASNIPTGLAGRASNVTPGDFAGRRRPVYDRVALSVVAGLICCTGKLRLSISVDTVGGPSSCFVYPAGDSLNFAPRDNDMR